MSYHYQCLPLRESSNRAELDTLRRHAYTSLASFPSDARHAMKRWVVLLAALLPNVSGCMYYAYPTVALISEVPVATPEGNVHAFRVDVDHTQRQPKPPITQYTFARIKIERGVVP